MTEMGGGGVACPGTLLGAAPQVLLAAHRPSGSSGPGCTQRWTLCGRLGTGLQVWAYRSAQAPPLRLLSKQEDQLPQNALLSPACALAPFPLFLLTGREFSPLVIIF